MEAQPASEMQCFSVFYTWCMTD